MRKATRVLVMLVLFSFLLCMLLFALWDRKSPVSRVLVLLLVFSATVWYLKSAGVTHEDIRDAVIGESAKVQLLVDDRYQKLDRKLDHIEGKLDRLLEIANRPLPDGLQPAR